MDTPQVPTDKEMNVWLESAVASVVEMLADKDQKGFPPILITHEYQVVEERLSLVETHHFIFGLEGGGKQEGMRSIGEMMALKQQMVRAIFTLTEGWLAEAAMTGDMADDLQRASQSPDRKHVIIVGGMSADGRPAMAVISLQHGEDEVIFPGEIWWFRRGSKEAEIVETAFCKAFFDGYTKAARRFYEEDAPVEKQDARWN